MSGRAGKKAVKTSGQSPRAAWGLGRWGGRLDGPKAPGSEPWQEAGQRFLTGLVPMPLCRQRAGLGADEEAGGWTLV